MTANFNVIHLSYKLRPWGGPMKLIRSEREGKQIKNFSKFQIIGFKDSCINNIIRKFFPPLPLFFFPRDQNHQIENHLSLPRRKEIVQVQVHNISEVKSFACSSVFPNYKLPARFQKHNLVRTFIVSMWLLSTKLQLQNLGMMRSQKSKGQRKTIRILDEF